MTKEIQHYTESIIYDIELTARVIKLMSAQLFNDIKSCLLPEEYTALDVILCKPGICQRDLAKLIFKDRANTGRILNSLEKKGFIKRFADIKNNRLVRKMELTDIGYKEFKLINRKLKESIKKMTKKFPRNTINNLQKSLIDFRVGIENVLNLNI